MTQIQKSIQALLISCPSTQAIGDQKPTSSSSLSIMELGFRFFNTAKERKQLLLMACSANIPEGEKSLFPPVKEFYLR